MTPCSLPPLRHMLTWLQGQPGNAVIGERLVRDGCAVQRWLCTVFPMPVAVDEDAIEFALVDGTLRTVATPADYRAALMQLDYLGGFDRTIRVDEATAVLREVLKEYRDDD